MAPQTSPPSCERRCNCSHDGQESQCPRKVCSLELTCTMPIPRLLESQEILFFVAFDARDPRAEAQQGGEGEITLKKADRSERFSGRKDCNFQLKESKMQIRLLNISQERCEGGCAAQRKPADLGTAEVFPRHPTTRTRSLIRVPPPLTPHRYARLAQCQQLVSSRQRTN